MATDASRWNEYCDKFGSPKAAHIFTRRTSDTNLNKNECLNSNTSHFVPPFQPRFLILRPPFIKAKLCVHWKTFSQIASAVNKWIFYYYFFLVVSVTRHKSCIISPLKSDDPRTQLRVCVCVHDSFRSRLAATPLVSEPNNDTMINWCVNECLKRERERAGHRVGSSDLCRGCKLNWVSLQIFRAIKNYFLNWLTLFRKKLKIIYLNPASRLQTILTANEC